MDPHADPPYGIAAAGHRLPAGAHVGAVHLQVSDLQRSIDYYQQVIGLRVLGQYGQEMDRRRTREAGFDEHLVSEIDEWLRRSELRRQRPQFRQASADR